MCEPISATTAIMIAVSAAGTAASLYVQNQSAKKQQKAIDEQNAVQQDEIAKAAGRELTERAKAARRERASMRAVGSEMGVNIAGGSFMDALQASAFAQYNDQGTIIQNERAQIRASESQRRTALAGVQTPDTLSSALKIGASAYGAYYKGTKAGTAGSASVTG